MNEAERAFKDMAGQQIIDDQSRAYKLHASSGLALVHLCRRNFVASERWCRQSLVGWRRLLGREHSFYNKSLQLLSFIHETKRDFATASAFEILSKELKSHFDDAIDARIENLVTTGLDTASSRALVTNYYTKRSNDLLDDLGMDIAAEDFEKDEALLKLTAVKSGSSLSSQSNITFTVRSLLDQGANANAKDSDVEATALMWASERGHRDTAQLLYERGADVNAKDKEGRTALHLAAQMGNIVIVECLLKQGANVEATERKNGDTALMDAARTGQDPVAVILLQAGAIVSRTDHKGGTALACAASSGQEGVAKTLLNNGAGLETQDHVGATPLHIAANQDKVELVEFFLAAGAKIDPRDLSGSTPLMKAAQVGSRAIIELLLDAGSKIDAQDHTGHTAAMWLLAEYHKKECKCNVCSGLAVRSDLFRVLVMRGANLALKDRTGRSVVDIAKEYEGIDRADIIAVLKKHEQPKADQS